MLCLGLDDEDDMACTNVVKPNEEYCGDCRTEANSILRSIEELRKTKLPLVPSAEAQIMMRPRYRVLLDELV